MKTKLFLFAILAIVCVGCNTVKQTKKTSLTTNTAHNTTVKESNESNLDITAATSVVDRNIGKEWATDKGTVNETIEESTTNTVFSAPDSSGKQWPTLTTNTKRTIHRGEQRNLNTNSETDTKKESKTNVTDKSDYKSDKSVKDKQEIKQTSKSDQVEETKTPAWVYVGVFVVIGIVGYLLYLVLKRFKVIK